ncbi:arginine decarboxylase-like [Arachis duranensis]|uniref:Arginine decarboxylase n=1 Tax=Arachis duranensis TaxID=130453 RepID=A0A6P4B2W1_ARADU|nr:arginine decarboxylase-like [Arachis duranensis]XP_015935278.1 arginine decarboxylase-like [Arachis duranensis]
MPALACCVDAAPLPCPAFAFTGGLSFPAPITFPAAAPPFTTGEINSHWSPSMSAELYNINGWGAPYFTVNSSGNVAVCPHSSATLGHQEIDLLKIVKKATDSISCGGLGLQLPLMVRFPDILKNRLESLQSAFDYAIQSGGYSSHYQGVFPVKCNQDRFIVEDIVKFGSSFRFGLEAGSKPELLLAMSCLCKGSAEGLLVCNGFKDAEYISLALVARKLALNTVIVLEQEEELDMIIDLSKKLCIRPVIGFRAKLRTKHSGHFGSTSGEKGKFGLTTAQIVRVVKKLQILGMLDCLQLLHFHIGSMIPSTSLLADGVSEAAQIYCELVRMGANMRVIDIGGGLGIDYNGSKSSDSDVSVGYGLEEYAAAVVEAVQRVCDKRSVKHPVICSESGRAIVSHQSVLVFEAFGCNSSTAATTNALSSLLGLQYLLEGLSEGVHADYRNLCATAIRGEHDACLLYIEEMKKRCLDEFKEGSLGMEELAGIDGLYDVVRKAVATAEESESVRTYHVNMSVFTSIPDFWGIQQVFPILPIHRLDEKPTVKGVLSDLTCDSDGKVDRFINGESSLPLHEIGDGHKYYLGMFLGGAYQEALGGLHNLFGGPSVVRVSQSDGPQGFAVTSAESGPSCGDVLRAMQHQPELMFETLKHRAFEHLREDSLLTAEAVTSGLAHSFNNTPYLVVASSQS